MGMDTIRGYLWVPVSKVEPGRSFPGLSHELRVNDSLDITLGRANLRRKLTRRELGGGKTRLSLGCIGLNYPAYIHIKA